MNKVLRRKGLTKICTALIVAAMLLFTAVFGNTVFAFADTDKTFTENEYIAEKIEITNGEFDTFSGDAPAAPSGWTETIAPEKNKGATKAGVIDLATFNTTENRENAKLYLYPEYENLLPQTPFGETATLKGDKKFLMINTTPNSSTVYNYTSSALSLEANKFYQISAWVKTGNFIDKTGASIRLNGIDGNYAFSNINTVRKLAKINGLPDLDSAVFEGNKTFGWQQFTFYVATSPLKSYSASVSLGVGDYYSGTDIDGNDEMEDFPSSGYAFFDKVEAYQISATDFNEIRKYNNENDMLIDMSLKTAFSDAQRESFSFSNQTGAFDSNWISIGDNSADTVISAESQFGLNNNYGFEKNPVSSTGRSNLPETNQSYSLLDDVLLLSSYDKDNKKFNSVYAGKDAATKLKIERFAFHRLSVWAYTENITGSGASIIVTTNKLKAELETNEEDYKNPADNPNNYESYTSSSIGGDTANGARYFWKEYSFYIQGSAIREYEIGLQFKLGSEYSKAGGNVLFHNVRFDKLTYDQYTSSSSNGTVIDFNGTFEDETGVANGMFMTASSIDNEFPLAPASWTFIDAATAGTSNYSSFADHINNDDIIKGIIPTDAAHFTAHKEDYAGFNIINPKYDEPGNVLVIGSKNSVAIGYRSSDITITSAKTSKITVTMMTDRIAGYGASIVLKSGSNVIASVENIIKTYNGEVPGFETFGFYVEGGAYDTAVTVEIWLGNIDRDRNNTKLSSGNIYVSEVMSADIAETESYSTFKANYDAKRSINSTVKFAAYSFKGEAFDAYDYYDTNFVKYPYNWSIISASGQTHPGVRYGIFDSSNFKAGNGEVPDYFRNPNKTNNGVLMLNNTIPTYSLMTLISNNTLKAGTFYRLTVSMKVDIPAWTGSGTDNRVGAGINLIGSDFKFENIKSTSTTMGGVEDKETFQNYTFYIATGAAPEANEDGTTPEGEDISVSIGISLGSLDTKSAYCSGRVYINNIELTDISNALYDDQVLNKDADDLLKKNVVKADLKATTEEETTDDTTDPDEINWWLIPSIIGLSALLLALLGILIRKIVDAFRSRPKKYDKSKTYDRETTLNKFDDKSGVADAEKAYSEFDESLKTEEPSYTRKEIVVEESEIEKIETVAAKDDSSKFDDDTETDEKAEEEIVPVPEFRDEFDD